MASNNNSENNNAERNAFGKFYGLILFIIAIVDLFLNIAIVNIVLSVGIIAGAILCLSKKYKLKVFTILALVLAVVSLIGGITRVKSYGITGKDVDSKETVEISTEVESEKEVETEPIVEYETTEETQVTEETSEIENVEESIESEQATENEVVEEPVTEIVTEDGVNPELKEMLDSYEVFVDQYVEFMEKYNSDPANTVSMLGEYSEMLQQYTDFADKINKYDASSMSTEDYKYYIDVTTRCAQKMAQVY